MAGVHRDDQVTGRRQLSRNGAPSDSEGAPSHGRPVLPSLLAVCHLPCDDYRLRVPDVQAATTQARRDPVVMARTAAQADPRLVAFALPGIPESVPVARRQVRAALGPARAGRVRGGRRDHHVRTGQQRGPARRR